LEPVGSSWPDPNQASVEDWVLGNLLPASEKVFASAGRGFAWFLRGPVPDWAGFGFEDPERFYADPGLEEDK